jgi:hypothetical protein
MQIRRSLERTRGQSKAQKAKRTVGFSIFLLCFHFFCKYLFCSISHPPKKHKLNWVTFSNLQKQVRDRRQGRILVDKDVGKPKSRYCASYLVEIMKSFDEDQWQQIKDIDFGGILELEGGFVPWSFVQWLAKHVNVSNEELEFDQKSIPISVESFGHVLGVPIEGDTIPTESKFATAVFLEYFGLSKMPTIKFFGDKILKKGQKKEEFVICFMTIALATFFSVRHQVPNQALLILEELLMLTRYNLTTGANIFINGRYGILKST